MSRARRGAINVDVYHRTVYVFTDRERWIHAVCATLDYTVEEARKDAAGKGVCAWDADIAKTCYVGVFDKKVGTLSHEMTHAAYAILDAVSVPFNIENNEALAYLVGYLVDEGERIVRGKRK